MSASSAILAELGFATKASSMSGNLLAVSKGLWVGLLDIGLHLTEMALSNLQV